MTKPSAFPHHYTVAVERGRLLAPPRHPIELGPPPQFGGSDRQWSPEELLVGAVLESLLTTFDAYARRDGLAVEGWSGTGVGILARGAPVPMFTSISLLVRIDVAPDDEARATALLATAERNSIVGRALNVPIVIEIAAREAAAPVERRLLET